MIVLRKVSGSRAPSARSGWFAAVLLALTMVTPDWSPTNAQSPGPCAPPASNPVVCENQLTGNPASEWDIEGAGDDTIQGFATDISVNKGQTVSFKIDTDATAYRLDIYRMGFYGGMGARKVATVTPSATLPQNQPACLLDEATGLIDCGNWAVSATWAVPSTAVSGIYFAKVTRLNTGGASHIVFVVRDDSGASDLLFQTSDTTWQAYNTYGGNSLYVGGPGIEPSRAYKVSYNRPFTTRATTPEDWVFNAEYPMVRWLEANGYHVSYSTGVDSDRRGTEILEHKAFLSVGHDEYWSGPQRTAVENARSAGVHLAFFSGNEVFWKTRWENSIAAGAAPHRTLVSYKETHADAKIDPSSEWTGTWRDPRFSPPSNGGRPENALTGTIFTVNCCTYSIRVPATQGALRFWRNTSIASLGPGQFATLPEGTLGYEWDEDLDNGFRPAGLIRLSDTVVNVPQKLQDQGSTYGPGTARHALTLYKHSSGALVFGAGTVQWSWGLDSNHDRDVAETSLEMRQATVNLFADMRVQPRTLQPDLFPATESTDTQAPTTTITAPLNGATIPQNSTYTIRGTAADLGGGAVAGVEVSTDNGVTWARATGTSTWTFAWQTGAPRTVSIRSRAVDDSNNRGAASAAVTVTVANVPFSCPCSIWTPDQAPVHDAEEDTTPVEVGLKFRATMNGFISGVRFYKSTQNTGTHVANLWTSTGVLMDTAVFANETASGWQQVNFPSPVEITANTTYVVSYHTATGFYAQDYGEFLEAGVVNGPLRALAADDDGPNGVYRYGGGGFPNVDGNGSNYWVDVVFTTASGPDVTAPFVRTQIPVAGASGIRRNQAVKATFSERLTPSTVNGTNVQLRGPGNVLVPATVTWSESTRTATLQPTSLLAYSSAYTATVRGGATGVKDLAGNAMTADSTWSFSTEDAPGLPPGQGAGGPILVVKTSANRFSEYYAEILRTEGLNSFAVADLSTVTSTTLAGYDVVVLGEMTLSTTQVTMFTNWVTGGGNLIAMRPDKKLASLLGLTDASATLPEGYLLINTSTSPGAGLVNETIQYHGTADRYNLAGASTVATLYSNATTSTSNPAVTVRSVGSSGGTAAAFTYDLARSVVYTRQGNPAWAGQERDGFSPLRSDDLFFGMSGQPHWVDFNKIAIPQADEQQRLFANLIYLANADRKPLPRFWYFPRGLKAAVVMTGDDHANNGTVGQFTRYAADSPVGCDVDRWECIRATSYIFPDTPISQIQAASLNAQGFELGVHIRTNGDSFCGNYTAASLTEDYAEQLAAFAASFPGLNPVVTNRTHCIVWSDYTSQAEVALAHGIRLDTNYYYWPTSWVNDRPGVFTGSGMPMRFAKTDGTMIDVFQATTQITDESGQTYQLHIDSLLDRALGPQGYYGAFVANMHTDFDPHQGADILIASATARGVPVISARQLLRWLDGKNASSFQNLTWGGGQLDFTIAVGASANGLGAMLPVNSSVGPLTGITRGGTPVSYSVQTIKGIAYAVFDAAAGTYRAEYAADTVAPVVSNLVVTPANTTATVSWNTSEPATSTVRYGLSAGSLSSTASAPGLAIAHSLTLTGLTEGTTYFYQVTTQDGAGNPTLAPATPGSFTTRSFGVTDTTLADFSAGTGDASIYLGASGDGEVLLAPAVGSEFSGTAVPAGWVGNPWTGGGAVTVASGQASLSGASLSTAALFSVPQSLEFVATFRSAPSQHGGFGVTLNDTPWAIFSTGSGGALVARTHNGAVANETSIPGNWFNAAHRYRIDWASGTVTFSIDGVVVATHNVAIGTGMRPIFSDLFTTDAAMSVDSARLLPYATTGTFTSRVLDGGSSRSWRSMFWTADVPAGSDVALSARFGNTASPDASWTTFLPVAYAGGPVTATSRYVQYRATLSGNGNASPVLLDVTVTIGAPGPDVTAPVISAISSSVGSGFTTVSWTTNEPATSLVTYGQAPDALNQTASAGGLVTTHAVALGGLQEATTYFYRVVSEDAAGNSTTAPASPLTFTTGLAPVVSIVDTTAAHFAAGTGDSAIYLGQVADGELLLAPAVGSEFDGTSLPAGWSVLTTWTEGGGAAFASGSVNVEGALVGTDAQYPAGSVLEFRATFGVAPYQHLGFALTLNEERWAMFSTRDGGALYARTHGGVLPAETLVSGNWLGTPHNYRIEWLPASVVFSVDGVVVATHEVSIPGTMRPVVSDFLVGDGGVQLDSLRMSPYAPTGVFTSRVLDAGSVQDWATASWVAQVPSGAAVGMGVRFGNTPAPDASWTAFTAVTGSGGAVAASSRYVQYRAELSGSGATTPVVESVTVAAVPPPPLVSVLDASRAEGNAGGSLLQATVALSRPSQQQVSVSFTTTNGTAVDGVDYTAASGVVTFAPGQITRTIDINVLGDLTFEPNETFSITLSSPVSATIGRAQATATIVNDDPVPALTITGVSVAEGNSGVRNAAFQVALSNPSSQSISVVYATAAGTATAGSDFVAASATLNFAPGVTQQTINVSVVGDTVLELDETFTVSLSNPTNASIAVGQATGTIVNDEPIPTLSIGNVSVNEPTFFSTTATFTVTLSPANPGQTVTVGYATADGTATTAGDDYTSASGTLTFAPGVTSRTFSVTVRADSLDEDNETFVVNLSSPTNATIGDGQGVGTINDTDSSPELEINNVTVTEGNSGSVNATLTVELSDESGRTVSVNFATANGSATAGQDYTATTGTLTFAPGVTSRTITVPVLADTLNEGTETFSVNLFGAVNAGIDDTQGTVTINDDDRPSLSINNVTATEGDSGNKPFTFTVTLSAATTSTVTVSYATANGSATAGTTGTADYIATNGVLTFTSGQTSKTITVQVRGNTTRESTENFFVNLSSATNATIADSQGTGTITNDD